MRELLDEMLRVLKELQAIQVELVAQRNLLHRELEEAKRVYAQMKELHCKFMFDSSQRAEMRLQ